MKRTPIIALALLAVYWRRNVLTPTESTKLAESIADRVWRMHHLDREETIDKMDWEQFSKQVIELLKPVTLETGEEGEDETDEVATQAP